MALMNTPSLLLLDEPTAGVDLHLRDNLLSLIRELADEGTSILYCTHFLPEVEKLRSSVAILVNGRIVARGSVADLLRKFTNSTLELHFDGPPPEVARPDVRVTGSTLRVVTSSSAAGEAAALLSELGEDNRRLRGINLVEAGLEAAYVEALSNSKRGAGPGCDSVE
jgi:ABC-2 type transport system ATP-binding protein